MSIKAIIIEDDAFTRQQIREILVSNQIAVTAELENGRDVLSVFHEDKPDAAFLDIGLPDMNGFDVAKTIHELYPETALVFITGATEYAVDAFQIRAADYLVKPFSDARLIQTIYHIRQRLERHINQSNRYERIAITSKKEARFIDIDRILFIASLKNTTSIITEDEEYSSNEPLFYFEQLLDPNLFVRTHRGFLVNISKIKEIRSEGSTYKIHFLDTEKCAYCSKYQLNHLYSKMNVLKIK